MKKILSFLIFCTSFALSSCSLVNQESHDLHDDGSITGVWITRDEKSDKPRSIAVMYEYKGIIYGRMIATYGDDGKIKDTIEEKKEKAPGVVGNPPYCGMDFVYNVRPSRSEGRFYGKIIDPEKGKIYNAQFWRQGDQLIVRGQLWIFGKNIPWKKATAKDLPKGFSMSEVKSFKPVIPVVK